MGETWEETKRNGSEHYKTGGVEPVDLYRALGAFQPFALCSIIKYAARCIKRGASVSDLDKIIDYATKVRATIIEKGG